LCNGPTYMALALWLNSPPCKWSGVEPYGITDFLLLPAQPSSPGQRAIKWLLLLLSCCQ